MTLPNEQFDQSDMLAEDEATASRPEKGSSRASLARSLVDVLALPVGQVNDNERAFVGDILSELIQYLDDVTVLEITERLSTILVPPPSLLRRLLNERAEIAGLLIDAFKDIPDTLLVEAAHVSPTHRRHIVRRGRISSVVADALLEAEESEIVEAVLRRPEITLSEARMDQLVQRTINDFNLREPLLRRIELQPWQGFMMFWWLEGHERRKVLSRFNIDRTIIQNTLQPLFADVFSNPDSDVIVRQMLNLIDRRHRPRGRNGEVVSVEMVERMLAAAHANPSAELCSATGLLAGISPETATRILHDRGGEAFAVMCKSIGLTRKAFSGLFGKAELLRHRESNSPIFDVDQQEVLLGVFDMIARDYSRTILRYWDWRRDSYRSGFNMVEDA